ncbi:metalloregulator ArsR/SmtB family transcription factor [Actinoplanes sp. NPDC049265]|uniref:metalloregulator ArsR/SmtB family transcription factor n=1 Tax=Actinoplanes sp. NPDC049265 TaxID=3363902 RepID=UPI0037206D59
MDEVAAAIADPVRRDILVMLRAGRLAAGVIADRFPISRPAVSRHLRVLRASGLVRDTLVGRQRLYELDASRFAGLIAWLGQFDPAAGWEHRLDALETEVYRTRRERRESPAVGHPAAEQPAVEHPAAGHPAAEHPAVGHPAAEIHRSRRERREGGAADQRQERTA